METHPKCSGRVSHPPHYTHSHPCQNIARHTVGGYSVCGTHKRVAEKWAHQGRLDTMVSFYWKQP